MLLEPSGSKDITYRAENKVTKSPEIRTAGEVHDEAKVKPLSFLEKISGAGIYYQLFMRSPVIPVFVIVLFDLYERVL